MASSCLSASEKLFASNSRNALSYMTSSSAFEGATLLAAKELSTRTVIATILLIFMSVPMKPLCANVDKDKNWGLASQLFTSHQKAGIAPHRGEYRSPTSAIGKTKGGVKSWP